MRPPGRRTIMCGIFGYVGDAQNAADLVLRGLKKLEYRGYDSWGVAVGHRDQVVLTKRTGKIGDAAPDLPASATTWRARHCGGWPTSPSHWAPVPSAACWPPRASRRSWRSCC